MAARKPAALRRREIADAALKVIAERGLGRFTSVAIAREVGVSDAALFRHFASKEAIVLAAIDRVEEVLSGGFPPAGADPVGRLGQFFLCRAAVVRDHPGVARLVGSDELAQAAPPEGVARVAGLRRRSRSFVRACLAEAEERGALAGEIGPDEAEVLVLGALMAMAQRSRQGRLPPQLPERVWAALERQLRSGGRRAADDRRPRPVAVPAQPPSSRPPPPLAPETSSPQARRRAAPRR